jgi:uncharacterized protein YqeY
MALLDRLYQDMKDSMRAGEKLRLETLRMTISQLKKEAMDSGKELGEAEEIAILQRAVKQRREAAEQYVKGGRQDLATKESSEAEIIQAYLPRQLSDAELEAAVQEAVADTGAAGAKDIGKVMGRLLGKYKGMVDGTRARAAAQKVLGA